MLTLGFALAILRVWWGHYRNIVWEIKQSPSVDREDFEFSWTYYLRFNLDYFPVESHNDLWLPPHTDDKGRTYYKDYEDSKIIPEIAFHGGCTFYEKECGIDGMPRVVRVGCDFQHSWDRGRHYRIEYIAHSVEAAIDSVHALIPGIKRACRWCGKPSDTEMHAECEVKRQECLAKIK